MDPLSWAYCNNQGTIMCFAVLECVQSTCKSNFTSYTPLIIDSTWVKLYEQCVITVVDRSFIWPHPVIIGWLAKIWRRCSLSINNILNKVRGILCVHVHFPCNNSPHPKAPGGSQLTINMKNVQSMYKLTRKQGVVEWTHHYSLEFTSDLVLSNKNLTTSRCPPLQWHEQRDMHGWSIVNNINWKLWFQCYIITQHSTPWPPVLQYYVANSVYYGNMIMKMTWAMLHGIDIGAERSMITLIPGHSLSLYRLWLPSPTFSYRKKVKL